MPTEEKNVPITYQYEYSDVIGRISLDNKIMRRLEKGEHFILAPSLFDDGGVMTVVELSLLPIEATRG